MVEKLLTVKQISNLIGVNRYRIYEWVRTNQIPHLRTVGGVRFDQGEISKWLKRHRNKKDERFGLIEQDAREQGTD